MLVRVIVSILSLVLLVSLLCSVYFCLQSGQYNVLSPVLTGTVQTVQMVRMGVTWTVQSILCPAVYPTNHSNNSCVSSGGCILPPTAHHDAPQSVSWADNICCSFIMENNKPASCLIEEDMFSAAADVILPDDVVLEVGARYGTMSCSLARIQGNTGNLISVEADPAVWDVLQYNMEAHNCRAFLVLGVLGEQDMVMMEETKITKTMNFLSLPLGYARMTSSDLSVSGTRVTHFTWDDIEQKTGLVINAIIFDCEGCMFDILSSYRDKLRQVNKIIIENDNHLGPHCDLQCQQGNKLLEDSGFILHTSFLSYLQAFFVYVRKEV